jgi:MFS transporter, DHA1 family, inner membrane transport protein
MNQQVPSEPDRHSRYAALALGMALPADTLLYLILPMYASAFGVSLLEAGILLAANRLVRIAGYGFVARFYARHGDRRTCSIAVSVAAVCALGYATVTGFVALLIFRLMWGLSFAALNLATQVLATAEAKGAAQRSGRSRALTALGPMLALPLGAASAFWLSPQLFFFVLAVIALAGLWVTQKLPQAPHDAPQVAQAPRKLPNSLDTWSFVEGLVIDGLFIIGLSYLGRELLPGNPVLVAGFLLSSRYMAEILLGSAGGKIQCRRIAAVVLCVGFCCTLGLWLGLAVAQCASDLDLARFDAATAPAFGSTSHARRRAHSSACHALCLARYGGWYRPCVGWHAALSCSVRMALRVRGIASYAGRVGLLQKARCLMNT